jgi:hypothetical protein
VNAGLCENEQMVNKNETAAPKAPAAKTAAKPAAPKAAAKPAARATSAKATAAKAPAKAAAPKPAAKVAPVTEAPKRYRLLTGVDDSAFCQKVSDALDSGYELYGSPSVTFNGTNVIAAQAVILKKLPKKSKK